MTKLRIYKLLTCIIVPRFGYWCKLLAYDPGQHSIDYQALVGYDLKGSYSVKNIHVLGMIVMHNAKCMNIVRCATV